MKRLFCLCALLLFAESRAAGKKVLSADAELRDPKRNRSVPVRVYFPEGSGPLPVIFFSHGLGGSRESYAYLGRYWAADGYLVIHPTHLGSDGTLFEKGHLLRNVERLKSATHDPRNLLNRPEDISFLIDSLSLLPDKIPALKGRIDASTLGLGGHAFGAYTAMAMAGAAVEIPGEGRKYLDDKRIKAFLALSPQGEADPGGFRSDSWAGIHAPFLAMAGAGERGAGSGRLPAWRLTAFDHMPAGDKWSVYIDGITHFSRDGLSPLPPETEPSQEYVQKISLAFWNAYLKHDRKAKAYLKKTGLPAEVTVEGK